MVGYADDAPIEEVVNFDPLPPYVVVLEACGCCENVLYVDEVETGRITEEEVWYETD